MLLRFLFRIVQVVNIALVSLAVVAFLFFGWLFACNMLGLPTPQMGPLRVYVVLSDSMAPVFFTDDALFVVDVAPDSLDTGDIITFYAVGFDDLIVTHRVIDVADDVDGRYFVTQGDNNVTPDTEIVPEDSVIGKYLFRAPRFGFYMNVVGEAPYTVVFPVLAVILFQLCFGWAEELLRSRLSVGGGMSAERESGGASVEGGSPGDVGDGK